MHPKKHILYGGLFALACYFVFVRIELYEALIIWISSWLIIDLDHIVRYFVKTGNLSIVGFWRWSKDKEKKWKKLSKMEKLQYKSPFFFSHGVESLIVLFLLSLNWDFFLWCFIGFLFHLILDWINLYTREEYLLGKASVVWIFFRNRNKKSFD